MTNAINFATGNYRQKQQKLITCWELLLYEEKHVE